MPSASSPSPSSTRSSRSVPPPRKRCSGLASAPTLRRAPPLPPRSNTSRRSGIGVSFLSVTSETLDRLFVECSALGFQSVLTSALALTCYVLWLRQRGPHF